MAAPPRAGPGVTRAVTVTAQALARRGVWVIDGESACDAVVRVAGPQRPGRCGELRLTGRLTLYSASPRPG